jgi:hypothetical protein
MTTLDDSTFHLAPLDARITFHRDAAGQVDRATADRDTRFTLRRIEPWSPSAEDRAAFAGRYYSDEVETEYTLADEDGRLVVRHRHLDDIPLSPGEQDQFRGAYPLSVVAFERDASGAVTGFTVSNGRSSGIRFTKQP